MRAVSAGPDASAASIRVIADLVVQRARHQGFVRPRDVREELQRAGESATLWKDVLALARSALHFRHGRYYFASPVSERLRQAQDQQAAVAKAARALIDHLREAAHKKERRGEDRIDFIQPVQVQTEDGRTFNLLSRDLSTSGMRLIGTRSLLGQKLRVTVATTPECDGCCFVLRVLWTCAVGDDLFENGGTFVEAAPAE